MTGFGSSCGACKFLRRKCTSECVFAPYFSYEHAATYFAAVHKVFGASNVTKLLLHLPVQNRSDAAITISYEALARVRDPVYGCVAHILALQQQVANLQEQIEVLANHMAYFTVGDVSSGSSQPTSHPCNELQFPPQNDMNKLYYQTQQPAFVTHTENTTRNQEIDSQINATVAPLCRWEDQNFLCNYNLSPFERLLEAVDQEIFVNYIWMDNGN
ncbi:DUF260 domain-containing protein, partial [Cephalotus follicularis]